MKINPLKAVMALTLTALIGFSCQKEKDIPIQEDLSIGLVYNENRMAIAKSLINVYEADPSELENTIVNCFKRFDGDRNILLSDLIGKTNYIKNETLKEGDSNTFKNKINTELSHHSNTLKGSYENAIESIIEQNPLMQLYYYIGDKNDTLNYSGIVLLEEDLDKQRGYHTLVTTEGKVTNIDRDIAPTSNYLVLSRNERLDGSETEDMLTELSSGSGSGGVNGSGGSNPPGPIFNSKSMKILKAKFVSLSAKRMFESWAAGEPEVRLNVNYTSIDLGQMSARNATFYYPKDWVDNDIFTNWTVWNRTVITCPVWYKDKQSFERNIMFTEEDGKTTEKEYNHEYTDPTTGIKTSVKVKVPASDKEQVILSTYIDYNTNSGIIEAGSIKFDLQLQ